MKKIILGVAIAIAFPSAAFAADGAKSECKCCKDMKECACCPKDGKPKEQEHKH
ncbi:hypothetical protein [Sphingomonas koreensis]